MVCSAFAFVAMIAVANAMPQHFDVRYVFLPLWVVFLLVCCLPCCCFGDGSLSNKMPACAAATMLFWVPLLLFALLMQQRLLNPHFPLWAVLMPFIIYEGIATIGMTFAGIYTFARCVKDSYRKEDFFIWLGSCCFILVPIVLTTCFLCLWAARRDAEEFGEKSSHWGPSLINAVVPVLTALGVFYIGSFVLCYILYRERFWNTGNGRRVLPPNLQAHLTMPVPV